MPPPIQLIDYVPEEYHFEVDPAYRLDPERAEEILEEEATVSIDVDWSDPEVPPEAEVEEVDHPDEAFIFNLTVLVNDEDGAKGAYRIRLRLAGMFQRAAPAQLFDDEDADNGYLAHTLSSCISMLYGAARNELATMTSQTPYGKFLLPPVSPMQAALSVLEDGDEAQVENGNGEDD
jgi:preprotein translocase subunit SecB